MKRHLLPIALALVLSTSLAYAQSTTFTKSLQGSQDPRGPVALDANSNAYFPNHINAYGNLGSNPTITSGIGGGGTIATGGEDNAGKVTATGTAGFALLFGSAFSVAPSCYLQTQGSATQPTFTTLTTGILATTTISSTVYNYGCIGNY